MKLSVTNPDLLHLKSRMLMQVEGFSQSEWQVGKSKIFLRGCVHEPLEEKRQKILNAMSVKIQKTWKGQRQRKRFELRFFVSFVATREIYQFSLVNLDPFDALINRSDAMAVNSITGFGEI